MSAIGRRILVFPCVVLYLVSVSPLRSAAQRKFEVASVKRADKCGGGNSIDPGYVALIGVGLKPVLMEAFKVKMTQIVGPSWLDSDCFDISAKPPQGATRGDLPEMLQALLAERFKLVARKEDRPRAGYALVVDKGGPKFKEDDPKSNFMGSLAGKVQISGARGRFKGVTTMASLAGYLSGRGYGPVQDFTGLAGNYDVDLSWERNPDFEPGPTGAAPGPQPGADSSAVLERGGGMFAAVREQLGLKLERRQVTVQFLVIDRVERIPTGN